jgi:hypothetical protein
MKLGKNTGKIIDYGTTLSKLGSAQVFIRLRLEDGDESTWYGVAIKKDGESNNIMLQQLAYCGFNPSVDSISDLSAGPESGLLVMDEDLDIYCTMQLNKVGEEELRISSIGPIGPNRAGADAIKAAITPEQEEKIKAAASGFKVRVRKPKKVEANPEENIPF